MRDVHDSIVSCIGNTPAVRLGRVTRGVKGNLYAKLEYLNPAGSVKDRTALAIVEDAERRGLLQPGGTIIEAGTGNLGAGLAMVAVSRGYRTIFVIPDTHTQERRDSLRAYGARVIIAPANLEAEDPRSYQSVAKRLQEEIPNAFMTDPCGNAANPEQHYATTGRELWEQFEGQLDVFISGLSTGGTISGVGRYLKEQKPDMRIIGVDPVGSLFYDYFHTGVVGQTHASEVESFGQHFLPDTIDFGLLDDIVRVNARESFQMTRRLVREEGLFVGGTSGATMAGALKFLRLHGHKDLHAAVLLSDSGSLYLSRIFNDTWMQENGYLQPETSLGTVRDLLSHIGEQELISVPAAARVPEVIAILKLNGISQVPVVRDGRLAGILTESRLLERVLRGGSPETQANSLLETNYSTVDKDTDLSVLIELFHGARVAVVLEDGLPTNIITHIDLIDFLSKAGGPRDG